MRGIYHSVSQLVGSTPLLELTQYQKKHGLQAHLLAKLEYFNPTGSIKDRAALHMLEAAEAEGSICPGDTIVEQTSGNTGISLAAFAVSRGYRLEIFLERGATAERRIMLQAYGAKLLDYKDALGIKSREEKEAGWQEPEREATLAEIEAYCRRQKGNYFFMNQVTNPNNPKAHIQTTGPEIWRDTNGCIDILVCMAGTGGTALGLSNYLREKNPELRIVMAQPHELSRITPEHPKVQIIDGVLPFHNVPEEDVTDFMLAKIYDECVDVKTEEAFETARELARTDGLLVGTSSAAALFAAKKVAERRENARKNIVVIMPDNGMKYLTTPMYP